MKPKAKAAFRPRSGFVTTPELLLVVTILILGLIAGWITLRNTMNTELEDLAEAIGDTNQSHAHAGVINDNGTAATSGSLFTDASDVNAADSDDGNNDGDVATEMTLLPPGP